MWKKFREMCSSLWAKIFPPSQLVMLKKDRDIKETCLQAQLSEWDEEISKGGRDFSRYPDDEVREKAVGILIATHAMSAADAEYEKALKAASMAQRVWHKHPHYIVEVGMAAAFLCCIGLFALWVSFGGYATPTEIATQLEKKDAQIKAITIERDKSQRDLETATLELDEAKTMSAWLLREKLKAPRPLFNGPASGPADAAKIADLEAKIKKLETAASGTGEKFAKIMRERDEANEIASKAVKEKGELKEQMSAGVAVPLENQEDKRIIADLRKKVKEMEADINKAIEIANRIGR